METSLSCPKESRITECRLVRIKPLLIFTAKELFLRKSWTDPKPIELVRIETEHSQMDEDETLVWFRKKGFGHFESFSKFKNKIDYVSRERHGSWVLGNCQPNEPLFQGMGDVTSECGVWYFARPKPIND